MGGEHHVSFHNHERDPCKYIHKNNKEIIETGEDLAKWSQIKNNILQFMLKISASLQDNNYIRYYPIIMDYKEKIDKFERTSDIYLYWYSRDDNSVIGYVLHDVVKLLMLAYPGKICACFDRCSNCNEYPDQEWDMCTFKYGTYDIQPKFQLYKHNVYDIEIIIQ